jgi:hypothetical protein
MRPEKLVFNQHERQGENKLIKKFAFCSEVFALRRSLSRYILLNRDGT